jgi:hypothetical protein
MRLVIKDNKDECGQYCAAYVVAKINAHNAKSPNKCVAADWFVMS